MVNKMNKQEAHELIEKYLETHPLPINEVVINFSLLDNNKLSEITFKGLLMIAYDLKLKK